MQSNTTDGDGYFDEPVAATYDRDEAAMFAAEAVETTVDFLAALAGDGRALELGVGTGRIALPLASRGVPVAGIELSRAMAARLAAKSGAEAIDVTIGDFATARVEGSFRLAYLVFNTIMNLTTQEAQVACFQNVAAHLEIGGRFVVEVLIPQIRRLPPGQVLRDFHVSDRHWGLDRVRRRQPAADLAPLLVRGRQGPPRRDAVPLRVAGGTRSDGAPGRDDAGGTLGRLDARAVHVRQRPARLGLA